MARNQMWNIAGVAAGVGMLFVGADNWNEAMDTAEFLRGRNPSQIEQVAHFIGDQPEVFNTVFIDQNNGPDESALDNPLQNAEVAAATFLGGLVLVVTQGSALRK